MSESAYTVVVISFLLIFAPCLGKTIKRGVCGEGRGAKHTMFVTIAARCDVQMLRTMLYFVKSQVVVKGTWAINNGVEMEGSRCSWDFVYFT